MFEEDDFLAGRADTAPGHRSHSGQGGPDETTAAWPESSPQAARPDPGHAAPSPSGGVDAFTDEEVAALLAALDGSAMDEPGVTDPCTERTCGLTRRWPAMAVLVLTLVLAAGLPLLVVVGLRSARSHSQARSGPPLTYPAMQMPTVAPLSADRRSRPLAAAHRRTGPASQGARGHGTGRSRPRAARVRPKSSPGRGAAPPSSPPVRQTPLQAAPSPPSPTTGAAPYAAAPPRRPSPSVVTAARAAGPPPSTVQQFGFER